MTTTTQSYRVKIGAWVKARLMRHPDALKIDCEGLDLFVVRGVVTPDECADLIDLIEQDLTPSTLLGSLDDPEFRTSHSCNVRADEPLVQALEAKIQAIVGIQPELGETVQGQRYRVGQQFKPHFDFFHTTEPYWPSQEATGGQRTWTAMLFLNEPDEGGHTNFTEVNVSVRPRTGNLLIWNNMTPEGELNLKSMHQGSPVLGGTKYVMTKWYRERPWKPLPPGTPLY